MMRRVPSTMPRTPEFTASDRPTRAALVDTHAHLTARAFAPDRTSVLERARQAGVRRVVVVGYDLPSSRAAAQLAERHPMLIATVGIHPHHAEAADDATLAELRELAVRPRVVAIGETGLDFYRRLAPADRQRFAFRRQLELAVEANLPVVVHSRDAVPDALGMIEQAHLLRGAVLHCFDGGVAEAQRAAELGLHLSYAGTLTYRTDPDLAATAAAVPPDRVVVETDAPYLTPQPWRGQRNEPAYVRAVAERLAEIWGTSYEDVAATTTANAVRLFGLEAVPEVATA